MNGVDPALAVLIAVFALRGYWRGFVRESFALLALVAGLVVAFHSAARAAVELERHLTLPPPIEAGAAFVAVFVIVYVGVNLLGVVVDRLASGRAMGWLNRIAGVLFGMGKGAAVLAFVLLFLHLFPVFRSLDARIMSSRIGSPLVNAASSVLRSASEPTLKPPTKT